MIQENLLSYLSRNEYNRVDYIDTFADYLQSFSEHAHRNEVTSVDVVYCSQKNEEIVSCGLRECKT